MELAARWSIDSPEVEILAERNEIHLPRIFAWYRVDFVEKARPLSRFTLRFLDKGPAADYLTEHLDDTGSGSGATTGASTTPERDPEAGCLFDD